MSENDSNAELKTAGLKVTAPRLKILEIFQKAHLEKTDSHLTAEDVYQILAKENYDIGLATVYRVLAQFEAAGILSRHHFDKERASYELDNGEHHDHIVCTHCGKVEEFIDEEIEKRQRIIAQRYGFEMLYHALSLFGICSECQEKIRSKRLK